jgi:membrane associated rhomboid family serine protease
MLVIPLGPEDREVRRWPWVTITIVALNVLVFVLAGPADGTAGLAVQWGFIARDPSPWRAVTSAFVHADFSHLAGNMIFLLATGPFLEDAYGRVLFPVIYLGSAISGCYAWGELGVWRLARKARPSVTPRFGSMAAALMVRRGQTVDAVSIYEEVAARFPADDEGQHAAARLAELASTHSA